MLLQAKQETHGLAVLERGQLVQRALERGYDEGNSKVARNMDARAEHGQKPMLPYV